MTWTPYSVEELANLLEVEQKEFSSNEQAKFARVKVPIRKVRCRRSEEQGGDYLFVVADDGTTAVVFDDGDQEFGICKSSVVREDVVRQWLLAGSLVFALMHLK